MSQLRKYLVPRRGRHALRPAFVALVFGPVMGLTACGKDSPTGPAITDVAGLRPMKTANNKSVPSTFVDGSGKQLTIKSGDLTITADGHFNLHYVGNLGSLQFDLHEDGTVKISGSTLTFTPDDDSDVFSGTTNGGTIVAGFKIAGVKFDLGFED